MKNFVPCYDGLKVAGSYNICIATLDRKTKTLYIPLSEKKFRIRKNKSKKWWRKRNREILDYIEDYISKDFQYIDWYSRKDERVRVAHIPNDFQYTFDYSTILDLNCRCTLKT